MRKMVKYGGFLVILGILFLGLNLMAHWAQTPQEKPQDQADDVEVGPPVSFPVKPPKQPKPAPKQDASKPAEESSPEPPPAPSPAPAPETEPNPAHVPPPKPPVEPSPAPPSKTPALPATQPEPPPDRAQEELDSQTPPATVDGGEPIPAPAPSKTPTPPEKASPSETGNPSAEEESMASAPASELPSALGGGKDAPAKALSKDAPTRLPDAGKTPPKASPATDAEGTSGQDQAQRPKAEPAAEADTSGVKMQAVSGSVQRLTLADQEFRSIDRMRDEAAKDGAAEKETGRHGWGVLDHYGDPDAPKRILGGIPFAVDAKSRSYYRIHPDNGRVQAVVSPERIYGAKGLDAKDSRLTDIVKDAIRSGSIPNLPRSVTFHYLFAKKTEQYLLAKVNAAFDWQVRAKRMDPDEAETFRRQALLRMDVLRVMREGGGEIGVAVPVYFEFNGGRQFLDAAYYAEDAECKRLGIQIDAASY